MLVSNRKMKQKKIRKMVALLSAACLLLALFAACSEEFSVKQKQYYVQGMYLYAAHCAGCHGDDGAGLMALIPPLAQADYLFLYPEKLAGIIRHGSNAGVVVNGKSYQGEMPASAQLAPIEIAEIITYITNAWGNKGAGLYATEQVMQDLKQGQ